MKGWHREPMRHSLAARGMNTRMDLSLVDESAIKWLETTTVKQTLTPELKKILMSAEDPQELSDLITKHEKEMAENRNKYIGRYWGEYLVCDEAMEIMCYILERKEIGYEVLMGFSNTGDTHVWVRVDDINYDPTEQGMHEGQIIERWDAATGKSEVFKYLDVDRDDEKAYWNAVVVIDGDEENERLRSSGRARRTNPPIVIVDLDGTVYDVSGRLEAAKEDGKYGSVQFWNSFMDPDKVELDKPIPGVKKILNSLPKGTSIVYLSGRRDNLKRSTIKALKRDGFPKGEAVILRPKGVKTEDWKGTVIKRLSEQFDITAGIGDTPEDKSNYEKANIPAIKVVRDERWSKSNVNKLRRLVK